MSKEFHKVVSINDLNQGAVDEIVKELLPEILENMADENTKWAVDRGLDIKIRFKLTSESRESMITTVEVIPKTAPPKAHESMAHLAFNGKEVEAFTMKEEPEQLDLDHNISDFESAAGGK